MTLSESEKQALIIYRLQQVTNTAEDAALLMRYEKFPAAANRIYYAVFYTVLALALKEGYNTSKHLQLIGWFNKTFIAKGTVESKYGKILRNCYEYRKSADYDAFIDFTRNDIENLFKEMKSFMDRIKNLIQIT